MSIKTLLIIVVLFTSIDALSQESIRGNVISYDDKKGIPNVVVKISDNNDQKILKYTFTTNDGKFSLSTKNLSNDDVYVEFSLLGYLSKKILIKPKYDTILQIELHPSSFNINEVIVKAPLIKVKGDTINYTTAQLVKIGDRNIGDVLKRIPGIEIETSGLIKYKDRPINTFYVDGKNLLGNQYSLATNNIPPDYVSMIQIFEKHEPIKVLSDISHNQTAAINLSIQKQARSKVLGIAEVGIGVLPFQWKLGATLFNFRESQQHMLVYKSDNTGQDIISQFNMVDMGQGSMINYPDFTREGIINLSIAAKAPISSKRTLFNNSHIISLNTLIPLGRRLEGVLKAGFIYNDVNINNSQITQYVVNDQKINIIENNYFNNLNKTPLIDLSVTLNEKKVYFQNRINLRLNKSIGIGQNIGIKSINQVLEKNFNDISNIVSLVKPINNIALKFNSRTQYKSHPENLNILSDSVLQNIVFKEIKSENTISSQFKFKKIYPLISAGYNLRLQTINSSIEDKRNNPKFFGDNEMKLNKSEFFFKSQLKFDYSVIKGIISIPITFNIFNYKAASAHKTFSTLDFNPMISLSLPISTSLDAYVQYSFGRSSANDIEWMNYDNILTNYRTISRGIQDISKTKNHNLKIGIKYSNPLKLIYISTDYMYAQIVGGVKQSFDYNIDYLTIINLFIDDSQINSSYSYQGKFSKLFFDTPLIINLSIKRYGTKSNFVQRSIPLLISTISTMFEASVNWYSKDVFNSELTVKFDNRRRVGLDINSSSSGVNCNLSSKIRLNDKFELCSLFDFYHKESSSSKIYNALFADANLNYKISKSNLELHIMNIFNKQYYSNVRYSDVKMIEERYTIRPRTIMFVYNISF
ncbi:MAG: hypothetical protein QMB39_06415 [Bacteroidales bacterium]